MSVGIDEISFYTANYFLDLKTLAEAHDIDPDKFYKGMWQEKMSVPAPDEDVVTMAASAALPIINRVGKDTINTLMFATETGVDQSKSAGVYVHRLLDLNPNCRVVELKQACYSATAAIQMACALVARQPEKQVLVVASDISRYDENSAGEPTQGCGAVAILISANPRVLEIQAESGNYTEDVMDFWRPNYRSTALVDGKYSTQVYLNALTQAWHNFDAISPLQYADFTNFCYHLPFSRMAHKAHTHLAEVSESGLNAEQIQAQIADTLHYSRVIGNSYTAALYIGLASLLELSEQDLTGKHIGCFSYGSGCVAEFFAGTVVAGYKAHLHTSGHKALLDARTELNHKDYLEMYYYPEIVDGGEQVFAKQTTGAFRLAAIKNHKREYVRSE